MTICSGYIDEDTFYRLIERFYGYSRESLDQRPHHMATFLRGDILILLQEKRKLEGAYIDTAYRYRVEYVNTEDTVKDPEIVAKNEDDLVNGFLEDKTDQHVAFIPAF